VKNTVYCRNRSINADFMPIRSNKSSDDKVETRQHAIIPTRIHRNERPELTSLK
jgi:hypothetical protein